MTDLTDRLRDVANSNKLAGRDGSASLLGEARAALEAAERENRELRKLVIEAYPGDHPTNRWRSRAERLGASPSRAGVGS